MTDWLAGTAEHELSPRGEAQDIAAGILVHRLFQSGASVEGLDEQGLVACARDLLRPEERAAIENPESTVAAAVAAWTSMRTRPDVADLLSSGRCLHEVPFSMRRDADGTPVLLRGTIDCLVQRQDGSIAVVDFKTGKRRSSHQEQLAVYLDAARTLFPGARVEGHLIYSEP